MNQKTAVLLRGLSRNYQKTYKSLLKACGKHTDVYLSIWDDTGKIMNKNDKFSYSSGQININNIKSCYKTENLIVHNTKIFRSTEPNRLKELSLKFNLNLNNNKVYQNSRNSLFGQMYCFQAGVNMLLRSNKLSNYDRIIVTRCDLQIQQDNIPPAELGCVIGNGRWHEYVQDFMHIIHPVDLHKFTKIYDSIMDANQNDFISPYIKFRCPCAEIWYDSYIKQNNLRIKNGNILGQLKR